MNIELLPNQPINFIDAANQEENCKCGESVYQQFYYDTDRLTFQFKSFPLSEISWAVGTISGNFTNTSYGLCGTDGAVGTILSTNIITANNHYRVTVTAEGITQGSVDVKLGLNVIGTINHDGEYIFSGRHLGVSQQIALVKDVFFDGCLHVTKIELLCKTFMLQWFAEDDTEHTTPLGNYSTFTQWGESVLFSRVFNLLTGIELGKCYSFCLYSSGNQEQVIVNGTFLIDLSGWQQDGSGWSHGEDSAHKSVTMDPESTMWQDVLTVGGCYTWTVTFVAASGGWEIRNGSTVLYSNTFGSPTTITVSGTISNATSITFSVVAIGGSSGDFTNVAVTEKIECSEPEACCDPITIAVAETTCKNKLIKYRNNESAFGFDYESSGFTNFYFELRLESQFQKPKYPEESENFIDAAGADVLLYFKGRKSKILAFKQMNELMHDAIFIARRHDIFLVNGIDYVVSKGEYAPAWVESSDLAPSEIEITKRTQLFQNSYCAD